MIMNQSVHNYPMARPVEIDRDSAFAAAFELFWRQGYLSTSLQQLLDVMQIGKSSFYAAFKSKEQLFLDGLAHYLAETKTLFAHVKSEHVGLEAIHEFLLVTLVNETRERRSFGCLAVNTTLELADVDKPLHSEASNILSYIESEFAVLIEQAQSAGQLSAHQSPAELANLMMLMVQGLRVSSRRGMSRKQASSAVDSLIHLFASSTRR